MHAGFPKTGTSYLQKRVFRRMSALGNHAAVANSKALTQRVRAYFQTDHGQATCTKETPTLASQIAACQRPEGVLVYSDEQLFLSPGWLSGRVKTDAEVGESFTSKLDRLLEHWPCEPRPKILITIRNQAAWLASYYAQLSNRIEASQDDFEQRIREFLASDQPCGAPLLEYDKLLKHLADAYGSRNVLMLPMEMMSDHAYWTRLFNFLGTRSAPTQTPAEPAFNRRKAAGQQWSLRPPRIDLPPMIDRNRPVERLLRKGARAMWHMTPSRHDKRIALTPALQYKISRHYRASNERLQRELGQDLQELGYFPH